MNLQQIFCRHCREPISGDFYFCPNCGKMIKEKTTISRQIVVYFVSLFAPPFGIIYVWKFLSQQDNKSKIIGIAALVLTIFSIAAAIWIYAGLISSINQQLNSIGNLNF